MLTPRNKKISIIYANRLKLVQDNRRGDNKLVTLKNKLYD